MGNVDRREKLMETVLRNTHISVARNKMLLLDESFSSDDYYHYTSSSSSSSSSSCSSSEYDGDECDGVLSPRTLLTMAIQRRRIIYNSKERDLRRELLHTRGTVGRIGNLPLSNVMEADSILIEPPPPPPPVCFKKSRYSQADADPFGLDALFDELYGKTMVASGCRESDQESRSVTHETAIAVGYS
ncbi:Long chronological lifespan protein [Dirofilaria immitis]